MEFRLCLAAYVLLSLAVVQGAAPACNPTLAVNVTSPVRAQVRFSFSNRTFCDEIVRRNYTVLLAQDAGIKNCSNPTNWTVASQRSRIPCYNSGNWIPSATGGKPSGHLNCRLFGNNAECTLGTDKNCRNVADCNGALRAGYRYGLVLRSVKGGMQNDTRPVYFTTPSRSQGTTANLSPAITVGLVLLALEKVIG